jgi:hypothetical protein
MRNLQTHTKFSFYHVWEGGDTLRETDLEAASFGRRGAREDSLWPGDKSNNFISAIIMALTKSAF